MLSGQGSTMRHLLALPLLYATPAWALGPGSVAFIGFNADGNDDLAMVTLVNLINERIYLTDDETDGLGGKTTGEGVWQWDTGPELIRAGTVIVFSGLAATGTTVSHGSLTEVDLGFNLAAAGDAVLAYQGPGHATPAVFLAGVENQAGAAGPLAGTGLTNGRTFVTFTAGLHDDGGAYTADRTGLTPYDAYLPRIHDRTRWDTDAADGTQFVPFDTSPFIAVISVPALPPVALALLAMGLGAVGARASRRDD
jgi:hypothetical protein